MVAQVAASFYACRPSAGPGSIKNGFQPVDQGGSVLVVRRWLPTRPLAKRHRLPMTPKRRRASRHAARKAPMAATAGVPASLGATPPKATTARLAPAASSPARDTKRRRQSRTVVWGRPTVPATFLEPLRGGQANCLQCCPDHPDRVQPAVADKARQHDVAGLAGFAALAPDRKLVRATSPQVAPRPTPEAHRLAAGGASKTRHLKRAPGRGIPFDTERRLPYDGHGRNSPSGPPP